jgi:catechol 2,3-dioxygenase-like lactoylglutathione lyase family enzyme
MLQVRDVVASSAWYQSAIGLTSGHGGEEFEMLLAGNDFVLQLHRIDAHEHGLLQPTPDTDKGSGVSLWFEANDGHDFDARIQQARSAGATIVEEPHWNPLAHHNEATLVDPDGYAVVLHSPFEAGD